VAEIAADIDDPQSYNLSIIYIAIWYVLAVFISARYDIFTDNFHHQSNICCPTNCCYHNYYYYCYYFFYWYSTNTTSTLNTKFYCSCLLQSRFLSLSSMLLG
jgi:hypothetical protein